MILKVKYIKKISLNLSPKLIITFTLKIKRRSKIPKCISLHTELLSLIMGEANRRYLIHFPSINWRYGYITCIVSLLIRDVSFLVVGSLKWFAYWLVNLLLTVPVFWGEGNGALKFVLLLLLFLFVIRMIVQIGIRRQMINLNKIFLKLLILPFNLLQPFQPFLLNMFNLILSLLISQPFQLCLFQLCSLYLIDKEKSSVLDLLLLDS